MNKTWDVFISHASEDKEVFVRPLANELQRRGVKVWYDEFELKLGDSLIDSISRGLEESKYGIVVFSQAFFEKNWTDYELKSLFMRQIEEKKVILPIWHNIDKYTIQRHNSYLLGVKALNSALDWNKLIDGIIEVVRPDIINSNLLLQVGVELHKQTKDKPLEEIPLSQIAMSPIRHQTMPIHLIIATKLISEVLWDVLPMEYKDMVIDFARDLDYNKEFIVWSSIANAYVAFMREARIDSNDIDKKRELVSLLIDYSLSGQLSKDDKLKFVNETEYVSLVKNYIDNYNQIMDMIKLYN